MDLYAMKPEEVMKYGRRVVLFPTGTTGKKKRETYYVEGNVLVKHAVIWNDGEQLIVKYSPTTIEHIYPFIERVYSKEKKGILIARRLGNRKSNKNKPLPLKKTGKGMGATINRQKTIDLYNQCESMGVIQ